MIKGKTNPELSSIFSLLLNRFDRLEKQLASITLNDFGGDELLDSQDIRILTKLSERTILRRRKAGTLPYFKYGGKIYYRKSVVLKAIQQSGEQSLVK